MIGIVIPGSPLITGGPVTSNMVVIDVMNPKLINNVTLFLTEQLPDDCAAAMYYSVPPFESLQFVAFGTANHSLFLHLFNLSAY